MTAVSADCGAMADAVAELCKCAAGDVSSGVHPVEFVARGFLVAWGGVLTLAFREWPPMLLTLKALLNALPSSSCTLQAWIDFSCRSTCPVIAVVTCIRPKS